MADNKYLVGLRGMQYNDEGYDPEEGMIEGYYICNSDKEMREKMEQLRREQWEARAFDYIFEYNDEYEQCESYEEFMEFLSSYEKYYGECDPIIAIAFKG